MNYNEAEELRIINDLKLNGRVVDGMIIIDLLVIPTPVSTHFKKLVIDHYIRYRSYKPNENVPPYAVFVLYGPLDVLRRIPPEQGLVLLDDFLRRTPPDQASR